MKLADRLARYEIVLSMRKEGSTFQEIGDELGVERRRAFQLYQDAMNGRPINRKKNKLLKRKAKTKRK